MHRLLPSIVFASTSLLACGGRMEPEVPVDPQPPGPDSPAPAPAPAPAPTPAADNDYAPAKKASPVARPGPTAMDPRLCENGWPTTKGQRCVTENGLTCCTSSVADPSGAVACCPARGQ